MKWYSHPEVSFKRVGGDIAPVCKSIIPKGTVIFYEIPVRSSTHFTLDIIRYTMQCVYTGEVLFPCSFNTNIKEKTQENTTAKVFFDHVFTSYYKRDVMDTLALSFMKKCKSPYLYKAVGVFPESDTEYNCQQVAFMNGETFLYTTSDIEISSPLVKIPGYITVPHPDESDEKKMEALFQVDMKDAGTLSVAMEKVKDARTVRPVGEVRDVPVNIYPELENRVKKYGLERRAGVTTIKENSETMMRDIKGEESTEDFMIKMEEKYNQLMEEMDMN